MGSCLFQEYLHGSKYKRLNWNSNFYLIPNNYLLHYTHIWEGGKERRNLNCREWVSERIDRKQWIVKPVQILVHCDMVCHSLKTGWRLKYLINFVQDSMMVHSMFYKINRHFRFSKNKIFGRKLILIIIRLSFMAPRNNLFLYILYKLRHL